MNHNDLVNLKNRVKSLETNNRFIIITLVSLVVVNACYLLVPFVTEYILK